MSILADKKPYFFRYIYPQTEKLYNDYTKNTNKKCEREFAVKIDDLLNAEPDSLTDDETQFVNYYRKLMPVGTNRCVMNQICGRFENAFDGHVSRNKTSKKFDYSIMKSGASYTKAQYDAISKLCDDYNRRVRDYAVFVARERVDEDEARDKNRIMQEEFRASCDAVCPNALSLCDIVLDICYSRNNTKRFAWTMCSSEIISNLLQNSGGVIHFPVLSEDGDISYGGLRFEMQEKTLEVLI